MGDVWEDEGYAGEDDWGAESVEADLEGELLAPNEVDEDVDRDAGDDLGEPGEIA